MSPAEYFTGYYKIAQDVATNVQLNEYISKYEKKYLIDLLGYDLYVLFIADFNQTTGLPNSTRFLTIYQELKNVSDNWTFIPIDAAYTNWKDKFKDKPKEPKYSQGISPMLKGFVFFHFVNDYSLQVSQTGVVTSKNENSEVNDAKTLEFIEDKFNDSIDSYKVIQNYIKANSDTYPEFDGEDKDKVHWSAF